MLEVPMEAAMPCKRGTKKHFPFQENEAKSCESNKIPKTKHACIVDEHESTREQFETISAWQLDKVKSKKEVILEAHRDKKKVNFATLMDICHLKNAELEPKFQKFQGRVVLRGDIVRDDSGAHVVFTEQCSSASQVTAAKVTDVMARLPDCSGQAAGAVWEYSQVKMEDAPQIAKRSQVSMSRCMDTSSTTQMA